MEVVEELTGRFTGQEAPELAQVPSRWPSVRIEIQGHTELSKCVVLGNLNLSEIIRFAEVRKGLANPMLSVLCVFLSTMLSVFRLRAALQVEILALRHQICMLRRSGKKRPRLTGADRVFWAWLSEAWADWRSALVIVKPETVIGWHRKGFRLFWTWKVPSDKPEGPPSRREFGI